MADRRPLLYPSDRTLLTALQHALRSDNKDVTVYTDSMTALQTLTRDTIRDNVRLVIMTFA